MRAEEEHLDVLQNLEFTVAAVYREYEQLTDQNVIRTYEALIDLYRGEGIGRPPRDWKPTELEQILFDAMKQMCDARLGRGGFPGAGEERPEPIPVDALIKCLKRLLHSAEKWNSRNGRRGYLEFMLQYVK